MPSARAERALAKVNLTLRIVGRRPDGYHDLESLVVFASVGDALTLTAGPRLLLTVRGPTAGSAGALADNLVLKGANALAERVAATLPTPTLYARVDVIPIGGHWHVIEVEATEPRLYLEHAPDSATDALVAAVITRLGRPAP